MGYIVSYYVFDIVGKKAVFIVGSALIIAGFLLLRLSEHLLVLRLVLAFSGVICSVVICGAAAVVSQLWSGNQRQVILVSQDAVFNGGGILFTSIGTMFVVNSFHWTTTYLVVCGVLLAVIFFSLLTKFDVDSPNTKQSADNTVATEWNGGIYGVGISLFLFMTAKISIFIWAPPFAEQTHGIDSAKAGLVLSNMFAGAFIGALGAIYIVSRTRVEWFLLAMVSLGVVSLWLMRTTTDVDFLLNYAFLYGISMSGTFNAYMAFGLGFVSQPDHKNVAYMLLIGGLGVAVAPFFSSSVVEFTGAASSAIDLAIGILIVVLVSVYIYSQKSPGHTH